MTNAIQAYKVPQTTAKDSDVKKQKDFSPEQKVKIIEKGNPPIDNNVIRGYN